MSDNKSSRAVRVHWDVPPDLHPQYASNLVVVHDKHDFTISFFDVRPPLLLGSPAEKERQIAELDAIHARCLAQIIVSASRMPEFVQVLQDNLKTYHQTHQTSDEDARRPSTKKGAQ